MGFGQGAALHLSWSKELPLTFPRDNLLIFDLEDFILSNFCTQSQTVLPESQLYPLKTSAQRSSC
jgi:hypothetical protein